MVDWLLTSEVMRNYAIAASGLAAAGTFGWSIWEKSKENRLNRFNTYLKFERRINSDKEFQELITLLEENDSKLKNIPTLSKYKYLGFLEEIYIAVDNKLMSSRLAFYMFGYYAIRANKSDHFNSLVGGNVIDWDAEYWTIAKRFVHEMKVVEASQNSKPFSGRIKI